jgi:hypothetical protein
MFVQYDSGLCPLCYNGRRPLRARPAVREVPHALALAGVLDDPMLEGLEDEHGDCQLGHPRPFAARE